jgi:hypothetical protein
MIVPGSSNPLLLASGAGYQIANSLRFRASNTAYLRRTIGASSTSTTVATWSFWIKRGVFAAARQVIVYNGNTAGTGNTILLEFTSGSAILAYFNGAGTTGFTTNAVFRDPSAWYHVVLAYDSTQATDSNRAKLYVNGTQITSFSSVTYPALNQAFNAGSGDYQQMMGLGATLNTDGYLANVYFIDGQALTPSSFGQTDATTGVWVPKAYSGTFGANGFFLQFKDAASTTTIGYDTSGNSKNFTTSGISVTSGVTFDQMTDTPTNNYSTLNPLDLSGTAGTYASANLNFTKGTAGNAQAYNTIQMNSGKWYCEVTMGADIAEFVPGIITGTTNPAANRYLGQDTYTYAYYYSGQKVNSASYTSYGNSYVASDVIGIIIDADNGKLYFSKNGTVQNSGDPVAGTNAAFTGLSGPYRFAASAESGGVADFNFGQRPFAYTPPTGFKALSTANITSTAVATSGSFTGNAAADGPFVWTDGNPATLTINGNAVTFGTHADKTAGGFKLRSSSSSYNASGSNSWTATAGKRFVQSKKPNNAQTN